MRVRACRNDSAQTNPETTYNSNSTREIWAGLPCGLSEFTKSHKIFKFYRNSSKFTKIPKSGAQNHKSHKSVPEVSRSCPGVVPEVSRTVPGTPNLPKSRLEFHPARSDIKNSNLKQIHYNLVKNITV